MKKKTHHIKTKTENEIAIESEIKLTKDLKQSATAMDRNEARYLISLYLSMQDTRKAADQKIAKMIERVKGEPHELLTWSSNYAYRLERQILLALEYFAFEQPMGKWAMAIKGVGPVIAAGLIAHIDIEKAPTVGHIWAFAGLDPSKKWEKSQKRPFNAQLKQICYYAGQSFMKCVTSPYRGEYERYKKEKTEQNNKGGFRERAAQLVASASPKYKQTDSFKLNKKGKLSPMHIDNMSRRYAVKQFLADWHAEAYRQHFKKEPPKPYPIAILGHVHERKSLAA